MINAIILYGSKARGDHDRFSDTDLLGIASEGSIKKTFDECGVSFHVYPRPWLEEQARKGSLFLLHLVSEAKVVFDPSDVFGEVKSTFRYKASYQEDIETGCAVVGAVLASDSSLFSDRLRRRYFWGLRTALMADAADHRQPRFSAVALEKSSGMQGLSLHIQTRGDASLSECRRFGEALLSRYSYLPEAGSNRDRSQIVNSLLKNGGVGASFGAELLYE